MLLQHHTKGENRERERLKTSPFADSIELIRYSFHFIFFKESINSSLLFILHFSKKEQLLPPPPSSSYFFIFFFTSAKLHPRVELVESEFLSLSLFLFFWFGLLARWKEQWQTIEQDNVCLFVFFFFFDSPQRTKTKQTEEGPPLIHHRHHHLDQEHPDLWAFYNFLLEGPTCSTATAIATATTTTTPPKLKGQRFALLGKGPPSLLV